MNKIKWIFLGTGGGRFVVFKGIRKAAGYLKKIHILKPEEIVGINKQLQI